MTLKHKSIANYAEKIGVVLAAVFLVGITLLFIGIGHNCWGWMAKLQFLDYLYAV